MGHLLYWAALFLIIGLVAAAFGFGGFAGPVIDDARALSWAAIMLFGLTLVGSVGGA